MGIARTSAILSGALLAKGLLSPAYSASVRVTGLQDFLNVLYSAERQQGRGVVTVCNHISTMDDPTMWGVLPLRTFLSERTTRWTLGANNILFNKGPLLASFFRAGQCLDTIRGGPSNGGGVYQPAIDEAVNIVDGGGWVHLFGEGGICQSNTYVVNGEGDQAEASLRRFKWGIGRIIMDTELPPLVVPMWITGFDRLMPEGRSVPFKFLPKPRQHLSVNFGSPISSSRISKVLGATSKDLSSYTPLPWLNEARRRVVRSALAELVRGEVMALGKRVSGPMLGMPSKTQQGGML